MGLSPEQITQHITQAEDSLELLLTDRKEADSRYFSGSRGSERTLEKAQLELKATQQSEQETHQQTLTHKRKRLAQRSTRRTAQAEDAYASLREPLIRDKREEADRQQDKLERAKQKAAHKTQARLDHLEQDNEEILASFEALQGSAVQITANIEALISTTGTSSSRAPDPQPTPNKRQKPMVFIKRMREQLGMLAEATARLSGSKAARWARRSRFWAVLLGVGLIHGIGPLVLLALKRPPIEYAFVGGFLILSLVAAYCTLRGMRNKVLSPASAMLADSRDAQVRLGQQETLYKEWHWKEYKKLLELRVARVSSAEEDLDSRPSTRKQNIDGSLTRLEERYERLIVRIRASNERAVKHLDQRFSTEGSQELADRHEQELRDLIAAYQTRDREAETDRAAAYQRTQESWDLTLRDLRESAATALASAHEGHQTWASLTGTDPHWAEEFPHNGLLGELLLPLNSLIVSENEELQLPETEQARFPVSLCFPDCGSLLIHAGAQGRERALEILFNSALRLLAGFPPGMAQLTIIDPVGLGQNFSALMELADHDETLIGGRIWTDPSHIEKRLAELTEHMEKVIQKYLRNRYATIAEYNESAGEMQEAYQFLLIADLPTGLSDLAIDRLASIISSGSPCGVNVLLYHDSRNPWPKQLDESLICRYGICLDEEEGVFSFGHAGLKRCQFDGETPPQTARVTRLLAALGQRALEAKRVELAFEAAAPPAESLWSRSSEKTITVPIGRSGATRLQELELGRGTAQHALIAGKTGSGKSTLFHVAITNTALWYSPHEVEFYLIDFKKGVEFKAYANHQLPHAQVIAIESDREFGLAVLKRLDEELSRRGDLFRQASVQDLASYRKTTDAATIPRTLLLIDEFQEFFTEDDMVSHEASLLLDRFVRQGRAFGVHLILGSQTLSGCYTLAKSTLGQMGVRIALQCNETDSYLILGEDNGAARLLSRPGEAIYNNMSGLVEGNNPFQVVWLPDEVQSNYLNKITAKADAEGRPERQTIVFESNAPAQLHKNSQLRERMAGACPEIESTQTVWLGEPNAIKGPTEARFTAAGGSHVLMVGQRAESVFGMAVSMMVSLAASYNPKQVRILVLDGSGSDSQHLKDLERLSAAVPHDIELVAFKDVTDKVAELDALITRCQEEARSPDQHIFLFVLGLQRFRTLRQEDDFALLGRDDQPSSGEQFANILRDGPEQKIHAIVWCDTLANCNRALSRRTMREFDQLVLFQMSAADSSELIDSPKANTLGLINALLYVESEGRLEKFRPYALPRREWLETVEQALATRFEVSGNGA